MSTIQRKSIRRRIHARIRRKVSGTPERPRLAVHTTNQHIYAQIIDDSAGRTLASASTMDKSFENSSSNVECAKKIGALIAERAKGSNISNVVFDRGGHLYHGKIKALADAAREGGLQF
ncbi:MAG: 50S ribosomal protein L18 [Verrucomicrobiae bacterium]|nr:50S ribosomal protein L18 [Verrucomicrobiae bacterium]MCP5533384.1 50S ribosomal protein L18 [Akkermansiaceae bacterium]MCP5543303.1 50S ribosomal protein L18 [Akkermansiaceae bacterium]MCP5548157.1 50S ribosomal protein L18 [Akkermansiaceae bacterium]